MTETANPPATSIVFGTDGWRARMADEYTFENVRRCADAVGQYVATRGEQAKGVVIAYDRRFGSEYFAQAAAEVLLAYEIPIAIAEHAVPTQMSSYEVMQRKAALGVVITASHNPWMDNGFKVKAPTGAAGGPEILKELERSIAANAGTLIKRRPFADGQAAGMVELYDPYPGYEQFVRRNVDLDRLSAADLSVLVEPLYGAGAGWLPRLLGGGRIRIREIHSERNPYFGGVNPEPIPPNVDEALSIIAREGFDLGLLLDGDADRSGAADENGCFIHQLEVFALLMYYLVEYRGLRQPVVKTVNETSMAERLGERYGVAVHEVPVGFKYVGPRMIETGAMLGGEESGGFGFGMHLPERDGIFTDLMLLDLFLREKEAGRWPVSRVLRHLHDMAGESYYKRVDVHVDRASYPALKERLLRDLIATPPASIAGVHVARAVRLDTNDGLKLFADDGSWLLVRFSGTEPLVRVYTEATSQPLADALVADGEKLVRA